MTICVLQDKQQPTTVCLKIPGVRVGRAYAPGPGAGLSVAPGISTRRGGSADGETDVRRSEYLVYTVLYVVVNDVKCSYFDAVPMEYRMLFNFSSNESDERRCEDAPRIEVHEYRSESRSLTAGAV